MRGLALLFLFVVLSEVSRALMRMVKLKKPAETMFVFFTKSIGVFMIALGLMQIVLFPYNFELLCFGFYFFRF